MRKENGIATSVREHSCLPQRISTTTTRKDSISNRPTLQGLVGQSSNRTSNNSICVRQIGYEDQKFFLTTQNQHLFSGVFSEMYNRKFHNKMTLHQDFSTTPAWSNLNAVSATGDLNLTIPIMKRMNFTFGVADTYLNNPSPGFRKNSFQFTSGITYVQP